MWTVGQIMHLKSGCANKRGIQEEQQLIKGFFILKKVEYQDQDSF